MNITVAEVMQELEQASRVSERPERTVTMAEIRAETGWGEKVAYRNVKLLLEHGVLRPSVIYRPNLIGRMCPSAAYQLV